jgi:hypothetical protein
MTFQRTLSLLLVSLPLAFILPAHSAEDSPTKPPRVVDPARAKAQEADRQRLLAKLRGDAPRSDDLAAPRSPLDLPIFRRYDRP